MELTELSLASTKCVIHKSSNSSSSESDSNISKKRKFFPDHLLNTGPAIQTSVDLQVKDPLPLDWEQCLDLESGRMYYLNRKTSRTSWDWPRDQKLDLELNISTFSNFSKQCSSTDSLEDSNKHQSTGTNMVALACLNCHLLVILSKSTPSCPNCKFVHSLPTLQTQLPKAVAVKSQNTLSLLN